MSEVYASHWFWCIKAKDFSRTFPGPNLMLWHLWWISQCRYQKYTAYVVTFFFLDFRTPHPGGGGGTRVHHGRVGSAGLCDLKILHMWRRLKKGVKILQWPPNARKGGQYSTSVWKVWKKGGQKSTIIKKIRVKILQVWKWGSKFYMLKNRGQNSTMLEKKGVNILHPTPKVDVKILHRLKKGGQKGRAYPLPKI